MANTIGGYDLEFLSEPPDGLKCLICMLVARQPYQHGVCGKLFCESCLEEYTSRTRSCPHCRDREAQYFQDNRSKYSVMAI